MSQLPLCLFCCLNLLLLVLLWYVINVTGTLVQGSINSFLG